MDSTLTTPLPAFTTADAEAISLRHFSVQAAARALTSERDQNFHLSAASGEQFVLRIANRAENPQVIDLQARALVHVQAEAPDLPLQRVVRTREGELFTSVASPDGHRCPVWLVSYLPGTLLRSIKATGTVRASIGNCLARLDRALESFSHPAAEREFAWDLKQTARLWELLVHVANPARRGLAEQFLRRFERHAAPRLSSLRSQVIHNDFNQSNLLVDPAQPDRLTGILDLGDMVRAPRINDVAIAAAYHISATEDPLQGACELVAAYHAANPLQPCELDVLFHLIGARLAMSVIISEWRARLYPENREHIFKNNASAWQALERIRGIAHAEATRRLADEPASSQSPSRSEELLAKRTRLLGPAYRLFYDKPIHIVRGEDVWLYDADGRAYLDAYNNVPHVGHCHPRVVAALSSQAAVLNTHTRYLHETVLDYAERIGSKFTFPSTVMFTCTGSEANDLAIRIARAATGNTGIIATQHAYHGNTTAVAEFTSSYPSAEPRSPNIRTVPAPDPYRRPGEDFAEQVREAIESLRSQGIGVAAFIVDSVFSSDGILDAPRDYLKRSIEHVHRAGGVFIADEVQAGFGRTGANFWGFEHFDVTPDLVTLGKSMGNGHPVAGVVAREELTERFGAKARYFNTFGGNPVSCAVGLAVLDVLENEALQENAARIGDYLAKGLRELQKEHPLIGDVRGRGLFLGVELIQDPSNLEASPDDARRIVNGLRERGVLIVATGPRNNVLKIRPPMPFSAANADQLLEELSRMLR